MDVTDASVIAAARFTCRYQGCNATYRRKEHLRRHLAQHTQSSSFKCSICTRAFGRNDTLRRHMRQAHSVDEGLPASSQACSYCRKMKSSCEGPPYRGCLHRKISDSSGDIETVGHSASVSSSTQRPSVSSHTACLRSGISKDRLFVNLFFEQFHPHWPFIHRGSFNQDRETPLLTQSMLVIGLWASGEQSAQSAAIDLHNTLNLEIRRQRDVWDASSAENASSSCFWPIATYQAILLHIIFALTHKASNSVEFNLKRSLHPANIDLLDSLVRSCKRLGMFYYPNMLRRFQPDDLPAYVWVSIEEVKRFNVTLYKVCKSLYRQSTGDAATTGCPVSEASSIALTAVDLQFPMPVNDPLWSAVCKEEWLSAGLKDADRCNLDNTMEDKWISNSSEIIELLAR